MSESSQSTESVSRTELFKTSNAEFQARWPIDVDQDANTIPLDTFDPDRLEDAVSTRRQVATRMVEQALESLAV